ncbi:MAG: heparinase II/III-family protein [Tannerellaceae bacterium]|nr:heparinase II/III-family protein [Tannerellaceae bacterium]
MKTLKLIIVAFLLCSFSIHAYVERDLLQHTADLEKVKRSLLSRQDWIPYPAYNDRAGWNELLKENKQFLINQGEKYLGYEWKVVKATDYIEFEKSGNRNSMQDPFGSNNRAITSLLFAELAEGKGRFMDQLINGVFLSCEMTSWVLSAHLSAAQLSHRALPDYKDQVIDLTSGDLSSLLSWVWYFFHNEFDKVDPVISERLKKEIKERTLDTYMNTDRFWWMAFNYKPGMMVNNWNPWCNFNVLQSFLLMEDDPDRLAEAVYRTMISVDKFINYTHSDGACEEGPSYWGHAAGKMYDYLQLLYDATGGKVSVFHEPIIKNMGEYIARSYVGDGWVVNFADASAKGGGGARIIYRYGKAVNSQMMQEYAGYLYDKETKNDIASGIDAFRILQNIYYAEEMKQLPATFTPPVYSWYPETEFCYMRNKTGWFLAAKGGYNNESHNHNDAGTFSLYVNNVPVFIDAGVGTYTRQTFSHERYSIWTMQSNYHNLPLINGIPQAFGAAFKATDSRFDARKMKFSTDISQAYSAAAKVNRWERSYTLTNKGVLLEDNFTLEERIGKDVLTFLSWGNIDISVPGKVQIQIKDEKVTLYYDKEQFSVSIEKIPLEDPRLSNVWGEEIYRISLTSGFTGLKGSYRIRIEK